LSQLKSVSEKIEGESQNENDFVRNEKHQQQNPSKE